MKKDTAHQTTEKEKANEPLPRTHCSACGFDPERGKIYSGPHVTSETEWKREWVHAQPLRFYLYKEESGEDKGKWCVIDRYWDLAASRKFARKSDCVKSFIKRHSAPNA